MTRPPVGERRQLVLVGPPGVGKSAVGRALAGRCGVGFVDADSYLEEREGRSISEIFASDGQARFRALELGAARELLARPGVVALGGGAVTNPVIRELLADRLVVWLDESVAEGVARVGDSTQRPLLRGDVAGKLARLMAEREPLYRAVASHRIDTDGKSTEAVARELEELLRWTGAKEDA